MPQMPCPVCGTTTPRLLEGISADAEVKYYRCPSCAHVWTVSKRDPSLITHVTPVPHQS
jgi:transposase-like protein